ncbi:MAG: GH3 auxin-responsive promoter family protein [Bacteroidia bacterium]
MGVKSFLSKPLAYIVSRKIYSDAVKAQEVQENVFRSLIKKAATTQFGKDHGFSSINSYEDFKKAVPVRDYEDLKKYIEKIKRGEENVLWPGKPVYFAKSSGTTSGVKYIPITKDSIPNHINSARNALLLYIYHTGKADFIDKKLIFFSGSPEMETVGGILNGRLSGIVNHHVPKYLRANQMPGYQTNCIEDWEVKVQKIAEETLREKMSLISGIPPWVQMYFDKLQEMTGKKIKDIFPDFNLFVYGGVNYEPYRQRLEQSIGKRIDSIEVYPASEGFIAMQDIPDDHGLLLIINSGIFYEFIPADEYFNENPTRISLKDVEPGVNYALILNTNAGLWGYSIGDTVEFVSKNPYRLKVTGRIKHFISAFGEHVIGKEVEDAFLKAAREEGVEPTEFTVAPQVNPDEGLPYHEWFVEFDSFPQNLDRLSIKVDKNLQEQNIYYKDLIEGKILRPLKITLVRKDGFINYMKSKGKLGGQNKVPRLSNDRQLADDLQPFLLINNVQ